MRALFSSRPLLAVLLTFLSVAVAPIAQAQAGNSSTISGVVLDPTGAVIPNASVVIQNPVSGFARSTTTDGEGRFSVFNVPFNPYHLTVSAQGFANDVQDVEVR